MVEYSPSEDFDVYDSKKKEIEDVIMPIMTKMYQANGGVAGAEGMQEVCRRNTRRNARIPTEDVHKTHRSVLKKLINLI